MADNIRTLLGLGQTAGDVGVEIEIEGVNPFPVTGRGSAWKAEVDGSLRGHSMEYVLRRPAPIGDVKKHLQDLKDLIDQFASKPKYSERAGVHIHVNVQELTKDQMFTMALVYYCLEHCLVRFCGPNREGNHFCLRLEDAEYVARELFYSIKDNDLGILDNEDLRYASLNFCSLFRYGSLEFRAMETQPDFSKIEEWAQMLVRIRDYAAKLGSFDRIPFEISASGPAIWARNILGDELFQLINSPNFDNEVMRCMRPIQNILYMKKAA